MIIFDLDGTLINSEYFLKKIEAELKCEMGLQITIEEQIERFGGIGPHQQLEIDPSLPQDFPSIAETRFRERAKGELLPCDGVIDFLETYNGKKVIASNGPLEWIKMAINVTGLEIFFEQKDLFHVGLVENKKPAPDLFLHVLSQNPNSRPIVVEDSLTGIKAGIAAAIPTFGYLGTSTKPEFLKQKMIELGAKSTFSHFSELSNLIK